MVLSCGLDDFSYTCNICIIIYLSWCRQSILCHILQGDYVLCRLFHKAGEKLDDLKYDEVEPTRSSPSANISSPDEVSSDLFKEPKGLAAHLLNELEDVKKWEDEVDYRTPTPAPVERCASPGLSHSKEGTAMEVRKC